ncbi:LuxR C-terminal-related transcriptional regulator [Saccharopolyspora shandongensis]|uniref:helix-turn-helix transcriptional regulator n=1 Tax=Saccharopolyspora shandongensis TaxID=418495 RepID=UPI0034176544
MSVDARTTLGKPDLVVGRLLRSEQGVRRSAGGALSGHANDVITVSLFVDDLADGEAFLRSLSASPDTQVLPVDRHVEADVVVVVATMVDDALLLQMEKVAAKAKNAQQRMVLISDPIRKSQLARIVGCGVVSILSRAAITPHLILQAVVASGKGEALMPKGVIRWLLDEAKTSQQTVRRAQGPNEGRLTDREVGVLQMFADGHDTGYVAAQFGFSERTIKKIVQDLTKRLGLRNRTHAVSYALRIGAI